MIIKKIITQLNIELYNLLYIIPYFLPGYYFSDKLRGHFMRLYLKKSGNKFKLSREVIIEAPQKITIGNNVQINARCWISGGGGLNIGSDVLIGPHVIIHSANHNFNDINQSIYKQGHTLKTVTIGDDVWVGAGVIILPGVTIDKGCIIGAGSIVTKNTEPFSIYVGNPARKIKDRK